MKTNLFGKIVATLCVTTVLLGGSTQANCAMPPGIRLFVYNSSGQPVDRTVDGDAQGGTVHLCGQVLGTLVGSNVVNNGVVVGYID